MSRLVAAVVRGALATIAFGLGAWLALPAPAAMTAGIVVVTSSIAGVVLAVLMARGAPFGPERAARVLLQSSSLAVAVCWVMPRLASAPMPSALAARLDVPVDALAHPLPAGAALAVLGALLFVAGVGLVGVSMRELLRGGGTADPFDPPLARCSTGPYAWLRHPMQGGQMGAALGAALFEGTVGALLGALLFAVVLVGPVRVLEAEQMRAQFEP